MDINFLTFTISNKRSRYKKNQLIYNVSLKVNEFKKYYQKTKNQLSIIENEDLVAQKISLLLKGNFKKYNKEKVDNTLLELNSSLENIKNISEKIFLVEDKYSSFSYEWINFNKWLNSKNVDYNQLYDNVDSLLTTLRNNVKRTIRMLEVLKSLEHKHLQALITFEKNDIDIHFIKYHINEESFSNQIKDILKEEFYNKYMIEYKRLENTFFQMYNDLWKGNVSSFIENSYTLFVVDKKMKDFDSVFLAEQYRFEEIEKSKKRLGVYLLKIDSLFREIYFVLKKRFTDNYLDLFYRTVYIINELEINLFKSIDIEKIEETVDLLEAKILEIEEYPKVVLLSVLNYIDPNTRFLKKKHIVKIKEQSYLDYSNGYLLKKADKSIFEKRFYSHKVLLFRYLNEQFKYNKYRNIKGFDKVFDKKFMIPIKGKILVNDREIEYYSFIEFEENFINILDNQIDL